jgi:hypothetical protein
MADFYEEHERELFESYMREKGWMFGYWHSERGYEDTSVRMLWIVWRDRAALCRLQCALQYGLQTTL